jgi:hypothetical protein
MFVSPIQSPYAGQGSDMSLLLDQLARISTRPRYTFMLLSLIAEVAEPNGKAGPWITAGNERVLLRDWLCDALTPMGRRDPKRQALTARVRAEFEVKGLLPDEPALAVAVVEEEVRERVRASGKTNLSRAVTELVNADLLKRHYQGYRVDHLNRGAQRHAVYTLVGRARCLLARKVIPAARQTRQGELPLQ